MSSVPGHLLVVTNPHSGAGKGHDVSAVVRARCADRGVEVAEVRAPNAAESVRLVRAAIGDPVARPDAVVCVGGDGLMHVLLGALARTGVPLGLVPAGTGNDLARELGIPTGDPAAAIDVVLDGHTAVMDLGRLTGPDPRWFATVAGAGFDARVTLRANRMRYPRGPLRYTLAAVAEILSGHTLPFTIELDGLAPGALDNPAGERATVHTEAVMTPIGNTRTYGGGMLICPDALHDDGYLDITVVGAVSRPSLARLLPALSSGKRIDHPATERYRARRITIAAPGGLATADGEDTGTLPITAEAVPGALTVLVPRS